MQHHRRFAALALAAATAFSLHATVRAQATYTVEPAMVATDNAPMLAQVKRVAITQFVVQFIDRQNARATSAGFRGGAAAQSALTLAGPGAEQYARIAEALYDDAVRAVTEAGIEVLPHAELAAHPEYAKLVEAGKPSPVEDEKFIGYGGWVFTARGLPVVFDSDDEESFMTSSRDHDPRGDHYRSMGSMLSGNSTAGRWAEWNLAKGLDAHLLKVRVTVPVAFIEASGGLLMGGVSIKVTPAPRLARDVTRMTFRRERDAARVRLDRHLMLAPEMANLVTVAKSVDNSGGLAAAFGMRGSAQAQAEYRMDADPARYEAEVLGAARATLSTFGQVLQARRKGG